jgi:hypothetical protein
MRHLLQVLLVLFGVVVIGISLAHFAIGPEAIIGGSPVNPTSDGEDRFFAGVFLCVGVALLWCGRDVEHRAAYITALAAAVFVGGIGRLIAVIAVGPPNAFYVAMLGIELVVPPLIVLAARRVGRQAVQAR